jgi:hypothetical protein
MTDGSVDGRRSRRSAAWRTFLVCGGLGAAAVAQASATPRIIDRSAWEGGTSAGRVDRSRYEAYVAHRGGVLPNLSRSRLETPPLESHSNAAIPPFARKYGLPCSACHTIWPELNPFGQRFKDNGYQLGNDRDSPIWLNPSYIPLGFRTTPQWRLERTTHQPVDLVPGDATSGPAERTITQSGFDISGADFLMLGTLYKDITFGFVPTFEDGEGVGIETAFVRFDNLFRSTWANLKVGKFELDNLLSEKRALMLSSNGTFYQSYHFVPVGDATDFGLGDNQIGAEWLGHSPNSYTRFSVAALSGTDGVPGLPSGKSYDGSFTVSQAFAAGRLGLERIGGYAYIGRRPTVFETVGGEPVGGTGTENRSFYRVGAVGDFFIGNFELLPLYMHGSDNKDLAGGIQDPTWNGALLELHYYFGPQFALTQRSEIIRMSRQADPANPKSLGNIDAFTFGYRWYPIMFSRAGLAFLGELSITKTIGAPPLSGVGVGLPPLALDTPVRSTSAMLGLDFDF